jgi:hypothetical protein
MELPEIDRRTLDRLRDDITENCAETFWTICNGVLATSKSRLPIYVPAFVGVEMKKRKKTLRRPRRKPKKSTADVVADMAASGLVEDEIAQRLGVHKHFLRARHIDSIKAAAAS